MKVIVVNGPNLGRLGTREPEIYGATTHHELAEMCVKYGGELGLTVEVRQSDDEAEIIKWLHECADSKTPVIINPAAFTHYSIAIRDAAAMLSAPLIEVHISNPHTREEFRHTSVISGVAHGVIAGFGMNSYRLALRAMSDLLVR
jgi:3-dehydroquinate dehydratase-2